MIDQIDLLFLTKMKYQLYQIYILKKIKALINWRKVDIQADYVIIGPEQFRGESIELLEKKPFNLCKH